MVTAKLLIIFASLLIFAWDARGRSYCQSETLLGNTSYKTWRINYEITSDENSTLFCSLEIGLDNCSDKFPDCCCSYVRTSDERNKNCSLNRRAEEEEEEVEFVDGHDISMEFEAFTMQNMMAHILPLCILLFGISVGLGLYYLASRAIVPVSNNISSSVKP